MTTSASKAFLSIGEVLAQLRAEFPEMTISKIRYLETEGLLEPQRSNSGYRKFSREDVARLRYVLTAQRDQYLPLRVIKAQLDARDRGLEPVGTDNGSARPARAPGADDGLPSPESFLSAESDVRLTREELTRAAGISREQLAQLEQYGLITPVPGSSFYDGDALTVATAVAEMSRFGIESRHLRPFRTAADREIGLFEQLVSPILRQRNPEARARAEQVVRELAALSVRLHAALVRTGLRRAGNR